MTHDELREVVARAMCRDANNGREDVWDRDGIDMRKAWRSSAATALAAVWEALREPGEAMVDAARRGYAVGWTRDKALSEAIKHAIAASPLAEDGDA